MGEDTSIGMATIDRYMDNEHSVLIASGDFSSLFEGYLEHAARWAQSPDPLGAVMMRQGLSAAALYMSCRPRDENIAWTANIKEPPMNVFLAGDSELDFVTGRLYTEGVETKDTSRLYVEAKRPHTDLGSTVVDVEGYDVMDMFETFLARSDQQPARFFDYDDGRATMLVGLPGLDLDWLMATTRDSAADHLANGLSRFEVRTYRYACGCTPEKLQNVLRSVYGDDLSELFCGETEVEVQCPRCGHEWILRSADGGSISER